MFSLGQWDLIFLLICIVEQIVLKLNVVAEQFGASSMTIKELIEASEKNTRFKGNQAGVYYGLNAWK